MSDYSGREAVDETAATHGVAVECCSISEASRCGVVDRWSG